MLEVDCTDSIIAFTSDHSSPVSCLHLPSSVCASVLSSTVFIHPFIHRFPHLLPSLSAFITPLHALFIIWFPAPPHVPSSSSFQDVPVALILRSSLSPRSLDDSWVHFLHIFLIDPSFTLACSTSLAPASPSLDAAIERAIAGV